MRRLLLLIVFLILYGSFYPWHFAIPGRPEGPFFTFLHSWSFEINRFMVRDAIVNVALYMPLGMVGHLALRKPRWPLVSYGAPVLMGMTLSLSVELLQYFAPHRDSSLNDFVNNTAGTVLGVACGLLFEKLAGPRALRHLRFRPADRGALFLTFLWIGYLLFPVFPLVGLYLPVRKLRLFLDSPVFDPVLFFSALGAWYVAGKLIRSAGARRWVLWLSLMLIAFPVQIFLDGRQPVRSALLGAIAGILLFTLTAPAVKLEALLFLALLVFRGLSPFHFGPPHEFTWLPFAGLLNSDWQSAVLVLIEKLWYYGAAIWLLDVSGATLTQAAILVAAVLAVIEGLQTHLPGRTAEITDPLLAVIMALVLAATRRKPFSSSPSASPHRAPSDRTEQT